MAQAAVQLNDHRGFFNRRLHSLLGVIPVGFFLVEHLWTNFQATFSAHDFVEQVKWIHSLPFLLGLEFLFIFLPLMYHGGYGMYILMRTRNNLRRYGTFRNAMFFWQRVTGVITLAFILWHLWETRLQVAIYDLKPVDMAEMMHRILIHPWAFTLYAIAIVAAVFHFSNGIWSFLVSWGITVGPRSQLISTVACGALFVLVSYLGLHSIISIAQKDFLRGL